MRCLKSGVFAASGNEPIRKIKVYAADELMHHLTRLHREISSHPAALPFLSPVDPVALNIPVWLPTNKQAILSLAFSCCAISTRCLLQDYFTIIKRPMDLSTMEKKLKSGKYLDPWGYIDDMRLMTDNACIYNKKSHRVYKDAVAVCFRFLCSWFMC